MTRAHTKALAESDAIHNGFKVDRISVIRFPTLTFEQLIELGACGDENVPALVRAALSKREIRDAIYVASRSLFQRLKLWENNKGDFNKIEYKIAKYLQRMSYRATPFGMFSCISTCDVSGGITSLAIPPHSEFKKEISLDSRVLSSIAKRIRAETAPDIDQSLLFSNDTLYEVDSGVSFYSYSDISDRERIYSRAVLDLNEILRDIINVAKNGCFRGDIKLVILKHHADVSEAQINEFIDELINMQLICRVGEFDVTSLDQLGDMMRVSGRPEALADKINTIQTKIETLSTNEEVDFLSGVSALEDAVREVIDPKEDIAQLIKIDLFTKAHSVGALGKDIIQRVEDVISRYGKLYESDSKLDRFVELFTDRFGDSEVPLLYVAENLDSLGFSGSGSVPALLKETFRVTDGDTMSGNEWHGGNDVFGPLFNHNNGLYIDLTCNSPGTNSITTSQRRALDSDSPMPITAMISLWESSGGNPGNSVVPEIKAISAHYPERMMGRFAYGNPRILEYLREKAATSSDDSVIAEIVHLPNVRIGNICSRPRTAPFEVRIRAEVAEPVGTIPLEDIYVSVKENLRIRVRSKKLGKDLCLRMSNAHNYDRDEYIPIYRFLNSISETRKAIELPSVRRAFPNLLFTPGIKCDGVIIARPIWRLSGADIEAIRRANPKSLKDLFERLRMTYGFDDWVTLMQGDHLMPYNTRNNWMLQDLAKEISRANAATLTDLTPPGMIPYAKSPNGRHFNEFQLALSSRADNSNRPFDDFVSEVRCSFKSVQIRGEWLYYKLLGPVSNQNLALLNLKKCIEELLAHGKVQKFFFIRHNDNKGTHLRIRLKVAQEFRGLVSDNMHASFEELARLSLVNDVQIANYVRETTRYGGDKRCAMCEEIFHVDSMVALQSIQELAARDEHFSWRLACVSINGMLEAFNHRSLESKLMFASRASENYGKEFNIGVNRRKAIGEFYRRNRPILPSGDGLADDPVVIAYQNTVEPIEEIWKAIEQVDVRLTESKRYSMQWALIHMRLNRILNRDQRAQEAVIWELLRRSYLSSLYKT